MDVMGVLLLVIEWTPCAWVTVDRSPMRER
jgi:hypothetical protein